MKTNLLKKTLALVLSIMVVLTAFGGVLAVFAEDVAEPEVPTEPTYSDGVVIGGTFEDGWVSENNNSAMAYVGPFAGVQNGDFEAGLKYWGTRASVGAGSDYADVVTEDGNTYITLNNGGNADAQYAGIRSALFSLPGVKKDDKLAIMFNYKNGDPTKYESYLEVRNKDNADTTWGNMGGKSATIYKEATDTEWGLAINKKYLTVGTYISEWTNFSYSRIDASINDGPAYFLEFANTVKGSTLDIDNVQIVKYINDYKFETLDGETIAFDPSWAGTFENGVDNKVQNINYRYNLDYGTVNADFSKGLMYWGAQGTNGVLASDFADIKEDNGNYYVQLDGVQRTHYAGFRSANISIPADKLAVGDFPALKFDLYLPEGETGTEAQIALVGVQMNNPRDDGYVPDINLSKHNLASCTVIADKGNGWKTVVSKKGSSIVKDSVATQTVKPGDWRFVIVVEAASNNVSNAAFDNFEIVKYLDACSVVSLDTGVVDEWAPTWAGTFENGYTNANEINTYRYGIINGDLEDGFKYWCCTVNGSPATTYAELVTENDNTYFRFNDPNTSGYRGVRTPWFSIPADKLAIGDGVVVKFDMYDPNNDGGSVQVKFESRFGGGASSSTNASGCTLIEDKGNGWKTYVTRVSKTISSASTSDASKGQAVKSGDWVFYVCIQLSDGKTSTAGFDNVELVKQVNSYTVKTFDDEEVITWDPTWAGTFEEGASNKISSQHNDYGYGVTNGDFENGLKYWGCTAAGTNAATYVNYVTENGNSYIKFNGETVSGYRGIITPRFSIPKDKLSINDRVVIKFDMYDPDNTASKTQVKFDGHYSNGAASNTSTNYCTVIADKGNGWKTCVTTVKTPITAASTATASQGIKAGDWVFTIAIQVAGDQAATTAFDNIELVKLTSDYSAVTLDDAEVITWAPAWAGTFEAGSKENLHNYYNHKYGVMNADFSEGLKYWGVKSVSALTDVVDLVNDNDNYFVQFNGKVEGGYKGFRTANISIPAADLMVGDYVSVKFDLYLPEGETGNNVQLVLSGWEMNNPNDTGYIPEIRLSLCNLSQCKVIEDKGNGWKTVVSTFNKSIVKESSSTKTVEAGDWQFSFQFEIASGTTTAAFDNFELVKLESGFGAEALIVDMNGAAVEADKVVAGDANYDGKVDLVDLVRTKKYLANVAGDGIASPISIASVAADASVGITADDITAIINKILGVVA